MASIRITLPRSGNSCILEVPFSSYPNRNSETFSDKLVEPGQNSRPGMPTFSQKKSYPRKNKSEDGEIEVFSADKYFSGDIDIENSMRNISLGTPRSYNSRIDEDSYLGSGHFKPALVQPLTPSIFSQSSGDSQSRLLRTSMRNSSGKDKLNKTEQLKRFFYNLISNCSCIDKKSADVEDNVSEYSRHSRAVPKHIIRTSLEASENIHMRKLMWENREEQLSSRIFSSQGNKMLIKEEQDEVRMSIQLFGTPQELDKVGIKSFIPETTKLAHIIAWDAIPKTEEIDENDAESDVSSDLFEIECLPSKTWADLNDQQADGSTPSCYPQSMVTASAADFPSEMSNSDEDLQRTAINCGRMIPATTTFTVDRYEQQKPRASAILKGCRSEKDVRVANGDMLRSFKV